MFCIIVGDLGTLITGGMCFVAGTRLLCGVAGVVAAGHDYYGVGVLAAGHDYSSAGVVAAGHYYSDGEVCWLDY